MQFHIEIKLKGDGVPTDDDLRLRHELEDWILDQGVGEIFDAGAGLGVMDISIETTSEDAQRRIEQPIASLKLLGITKSTSGSSRALRPRSTQSHASRGM
jgi:hypothetical protein